MSSNYNTETGIEVLAETWKHANSYRIHKGLGIIIDPAFERDENESCHYVLLTHVHFDHMFTLDDWRAPESAILLLGEEDAPLLQSEEGNASKLFGKSRTYEAADRLLHDGDLIELDETYALRVIATPGHTHGSACFLYFRRHEGGEEPLALFTGDTLFATSIGRSDLMGGEPQEMKATVKHLRDFLQTLPQSLAILPGHGPASTVADVLLRNPFMKGDGFFA